MADLIARMKKFSYKPQPVRRAYIPKANGKLRPLGIPAYEDRLVQSVMAGVLSDIYEERFLDCSYGVRPGRSAHDVVRVINQTAMRHHVNYSTRLADEKKTLEAFRDHIKSGTTLIHDKESLHAKLIEVLGRECPSNRVNGIISA